MAEINLRELMRKPIYLKDSGYVLEFTPIIIDGNYCVVLGVRAADGALDFKPSAALSHKVIDALLSTAGLPLLPFTPIIADAAGRVILSASEQDGALDFVPSGNLATKIQALASYGLNGVTGSFSDLTVFSPVIQQTDRLRTFHALDSGGVERRYFVRSDIPQILALEATAGPIEMIVAAGESTAAGGGNSAVLHLSSPPETHRCVMFSGGSSGGTMNVQAAVFSPSGVVGFEPCKEIHDDGKGETQLTALGAWRDAQIVANNRTRRTFLMRSHAQRGDTMAQIAKGQQPYANGMAEITRAVEIADEVWRRKLIVRAIHLTSGVNDRAAGTTRTAIRDAYIQACTDYNTDVPALTGQAAGTLPLNIDQLRAPASGAFTNDVALGQLDAIEADARILLVSPEYFLVGTYGMYDNAHDLALGYDVRGEYKAKLLYDLFDAPSPIAYTAWKGLRPSSIALSGGDTQIDITFFVPVAPLLLDTTSLANFGNYGFRYADTEGGISISGVSILNPTTVRVALSGAITGHTNRTIGYADADTAADQTGKAKVWGNLHDSETRESIVVPGLKLYNWCATFRKVI